MKADPIKVRPRHRVSIVETFSQGLWVDNKRSVTGSVPRARKPSPRGHWNLPPLPCESHLLFLDSETRIPEACRPNSGTGLYAQALMSTQIKQTTHREQNVKISKPIKTKNLPKEEKGTRLLHSGDMGADMNHTSKNCSYPNYKARDYLLFLYFWERSFTQKCDMYRYGLFNLTKRWSTSVTMRERQIKTTMM